MKNEYSIVSKHTDVYNGSDLGRTDLAVVPLGTYYLSSVI